MTGIWRNRLIHLFAFVADYGSHIIFLQFLTSLKACKLHQEHDFHNLSSKLLDQLGSSLQQYRL